MKFIRKTIIGVSTLLFTAVTLTSTTYAWFKINSRATVTGFNISAHSGQGFMVSIDNVNYSNDLTAEQLEMAMLAGYNSDEFKVRYNYETNLTSVYKKSGEVQKQDDTEPDGLAWEKYDDGTYITDENGDKIPVTENLYDNELSRTDVLKELEAIQLLPTTSLDGRRITDLWNSEQSSSQGKYVNFQIYFRTASTKEEDNFTYDIYLNGEEKTSDNDQIISPTRMTSETTIVPLNAGMKAIKNNGTLENPVYVVQDLARFQNIEVYSSNAFRFSITDENALATEGASYISNIYELNDSVNGIKDLGSYATTYSNDYCDLNGLTYSDELFYKYSSTCNAMYTYYNNLRPSSQLQAKEYLYFPETIKDLVSKDENGDYIYNKKITTLSSGEDGKLITFKIWLEGWDADCFDGLKNSVDLALSFSSVRIL